MQHSNFEKDHDETSIATAPPEMKQKIWKRYIDDSLEIMKKDQKDPFTDHLNSIDPTGSIKFRQATSREDPSPS